MFEIAAKHRTKWEPTLGAQQPISIIPISRGSLAEKRIFTMGSCFALEVRHHLATLGFDTYPKYFDISFDASKATLGKLPDKDNINHYSIASILQEFEIACKAKSISLSDHFVDLNGDQSIARQLRLFARAVRQQIKSPGATSFQPAWQDPFRKQCYAESREVLAELSDKVTARISDGIAKCDVFILTLGMTETWIDKSSGLTVCNSYGAKVDEKLFEFVDLSFDQTKKSIQKVIKLIRQQNEKADIIFTVSPVPLSRTAKNESVVTANATSKARQRAAIAEVVAEQSNVFYFPSYELSRDTDFFREDGRHVRQEKVHYIVEQFVRWYQGG